MIELECLGAAWAMHKCRQFLEGLPSFELVTDHKPLVPILNDYSLDKIDNPRLLRLRLKMQRYSFTTRWIPGKQNVGADALSRAPVERPSSDDELGEGLPNFSPRIALVGFNNVETAPNAATADPKLEKVRSAAKSDVILQKLRQQIITGFQNDKCNLDLDLRPFWCVKEHLAIDEVDDMVVMGPRVVVPKSMRAEVLSRLVAMHQGATKTRQRARTSVYWPGMDNDIENATRNCKKCNERMPSLPPEPLKQRPAPTRPFEHVHADIGTINGRDFLVIVDGFSGWPHVAMFSDGNTSARKIIEQVRLFFSSVGVPIAFWSDNGPQFAASDFKKFLHDWGVNACTSSPHYAQSNGRAEAEIKSMKTLIKWAWASGVFSADTCQGQAEHLPHKSSSTDLYAIRYLPIEDLLRQNGRKLLTSWRNEPVVQKTFKSSITTEKLAHWNHSQWEPTLSFSIPSASYG